MATAGRWWVLVSGLGLFLWLLGGCAPPPPPGHGPSPSPKASRRAPPSPPVPSGPLPGEPSGEEPPAPAPPEVWEQIEREVADLRQLPIREPIRRRFYPPEVWTSVVAQRFRKVYPPAQAERDAELGALLGWWPEGYDLWQAALAASQATQQGFYDCATGTVALVWKKQEEMPALALMYAHQVVHALQHQNLGFCPPAQRPALPGTLSEEDGAWQALVEGDATLTELMWYTTTATEDERQALLRALAHQPSEEGVPDLPLALRWRWAFPYQAGLNFVQALYSRGGWQVVDQAYAAPPWSTAQILHPETYPEQQPEEMSWPTAAALLGPGWRVAAQGPLGEADVRALLGAAWQPDLRLDGVTTWQAAEGWVGGGFVLYQHPQGGRAWAVVLRWRDGNDRYQFTQAFLQYGLRRFGPPLQANEEHAVWQTEEGMHGLSARQRTTVWAWAPDGASLQALLQGFFP